VIFARPFHRRPPLAVAFAGLLLVAATAAAPARAGVVLVLKSGSLAPYNATVAGFRSAHRGDVVEASLDEGDAAAMIARVNAAHAEVVVAVGLKAAMFTREHFPRMPLVFCVVQNWERYGLTGSWVTGVSTDVPAGVELSALHAAAPDVRRIGMLYGATTGAELEREARSAAAASHLTLVSRPIASLSELPDEARNLVAHVDALWMPADPMLATTEVFRFLLDLSLTQRKPLLVFSEALVRAGAFLAVTPDYDWVGARVAEAVQRIQTGDRAGDVPVTPLRHTRVVVNPSTARALGREAPGLPVESAETVR
jgi:putative ABC transport system substrate-binding protein